MSFLDSEGTVWGNFLAESPTVTAAWTSDGKRFGWMDKNFRLHLVDVRTREHHELPCPCLGLARLGGDLATVSTDGSALILLGATNTARRVPFSPPLPGGSSVRAGGTDRVAISEAVPEEQTDYRGQTRLVSAGADGVTTPMMNGKSLASIWDGFSAPDGQRIAAIESPSAGACNTLPALLPLRHGEPGASSTPLVPSDRPFKEAVLDESRLITGVTWAGNTIVVTFGANSACLFAYPSRYVTYAFSDGTWQYLRDRALTLAYGPEGRSYSIELGEDIKGKTDLAGKLVRSSPKGSKDITDSVTNLWLTPAESAGGRPTPSSPPADERITTTERGSALSKDFLEVTDRIATALDRNDEAALVRLCEKCDPETSSLIRSPEGRTQLRRTLRTHPAGDDRSLIYPGLAAKGCVDGYNASPTCTVLQLRDIGLLGLKAEFAEVYPGRSYTAPTTASISLARDETGRIRWAGRSNSANEYKQKPPYANAAEYYMFTSADKKYLCGIATDYAACQGPTAPLPARPDSCRASWGNGIKVSPDKTAEFLCAGGVIFWPADGKEPADRFVLPPGQTISALGFTCSADEKGVLCSHDKSNHGFHITPETNDRR